MNPLLAVALAVVLVAYIVAGFLDRRRWGGRP